MIWLFDSGPPVEYELLPAGAIVFRLVVMWLWMSWPIAMMIHHDGDVSARKAAWLGLAWPAFVVWLAVMSVLWMFGMEFGRKKE